MRSARVLHQGRLGEVTVTADYGSTVGVRFTPDGGEAHPSGERWTRDYLKRATNAAYELDRTEEANHDA